MKIYTKTGDLGLTSLGNGKRVPKCDMNIQVLGDLDELNCHIGYLLSINIDKYTEYLSYLQNLLFDIGAVVADNRKADDKFEQLMLKEINYLESEIDIITEKLPTLNTFIMPGGTNVNPFAAYLHILRAVCRRSERSLVEQQVNKSIIMFINRLSDYFFTIARDMANNMEKKKLNKN